MHGVTYETEDGRKAVTIVLRVQIALDDPDKAGEALADMHATLRPHIAKYGDDAKIVSDKMDGWDY